MSKATRYRIRRVEALAGAQFGCVGGALAALPVALMGGWIVRIVVSAARYTLEGWQRVPVDVGALGQMPLDIVTVLNMNHWLARLQFLDNMPLLVIIGMTLIIMLLFGSFGSILIGLGAVIYNSIAALSGGLAIDLEPVECAKTQIAQS